MKKVLHIINGEFFAGAERVQDLLAINLPSFDYECEFICLKDGIFDERRSSKVPLKTFAMKSKYDFSVVKHIVDYAQDKNFTLVHTHTARNALIGRKVSKALNLPLVHHVHSPTSRDTENPLRNWLNAFLEDYIVLPNANHLIPVSYSLKDYLIEHRVPEEKITPVPNGVPVINDVPDWKPPQSGQPWIIGTVALFRPRKGLEVLLQAISILKKQGANIVLKVVGPFETESYEIEIKQLAEELSITDKIEWTGFCSDIHSQMKSMHTFVLPSLFGEGLPMVVIEAMSVGTPVVSTDVEGIPYVLEEGKSGEIVTPNDADALAKGIQQYISGHKSPIEISNRCKHRQRDLFSDQSMARSIAEVYDQVLNTSI